MKGFQEGIKETFNVKTLIMLACAVVGFMAARMLQRHVLRNVRPLAGVPEISDIAVMVLGGGFVRGNNGTAVMIGAGISLVNNLGGRLRVPWLRVG